MPIKKEIVMTIEQEVAVKRLVTTIRDNRDAIADVFGRVKKRGGWTVAAAREYKVLPDERNAKDLSMESHEVLRELERLQETVKLAIKSIGVAHDRMRDECGLNKNLS